MAKFSGITTGGPVIPATDQLVAVRNSTSDVLVTPPTSLPPNGSAGGDLSGSYPNPTVATIGGKSLGTAAFQSIVSYNLADYTAVSAGADVTTILQSCGIAVHLQAIAMGALHLADQGTRVRSKLRCPASYPISISCPYIHLPFVDIDFPTQILRSVPSGGTVTSFYNGDTTSKALTNLYQPAVYQSLLSHVTELDVNNNPGGGNSGAGWIGQRYWSMLTGGAGFTVGAAGSGYVNGDIVTVGIGGLIGPFVAATFTLTVSAGVVTAVTLNNAGIYPAPPKILRSMWGDPTVGWTNPTGGPTWASLVTAGTVSAVFDPGGNWLTTGGTGTGLTIHIADDTTAWKPDFSGGQYNNLFQSLIVDTQIGRLKSANCGNTTSGTYGPMLASFMTNNNVWVDSWETNGGYYGVYWTGADYKVGQMHLVGAFCTFKQFAGGDNHCLEMVLDSPTDHYAEIDHCQGNVFKGRCFTTSGVDMTGSYAFQIGNNGSNSTNQIYGCTFDFQMMNAGTSAGIPALYVAFIQDCVLNFNISNINSKLGTAAAKQMSSFATFGSGVYSNNKITGSIDGVFGQIYSGSLPACSFDIWDAEVPIKAGSITATIGGTATNGDSITLTFTNVGIFGWPKTAAITVTTSETTTAMATALAAAINAATSLTGYGVAATSNASVVTITQTGSQANTTVVTSTIGGSATETVTLSNSGAISGAISGGKFMTGGIYEMSAVGVPTNGVTGLNKAIAGSRYTNTSTGSLYVNGGTASAPVWNVISSSTSIVITPTAGRFYMPPYFSGLGTLTQPVSGGNSVAYAVPFPLAASKAPVSMAMEVTTGSTTGSFQIDMGIYADNNGQPGTLLLDIGTTTTGTITVAQAATGVQLQSIPAGSFAGGTSILSPGLYWLGLISSIPTSAGSLAFKSMQTNNTFGRGMVGDLLTQGSASPSAPAVAYIKNTAANSAVLPTSFTGPASAGVSPPAMWLGF